MHCLCPTPNRRRMPPLRTAAAKRCVATPVDLDRLTLLPRVSESISINSFGQVAALRLGETRVVGPGKQSSTVQQPAHFTCRVGSNGCRAGCLGCNQTGFSPSHFLKVRITACSPRRAGDKVLSRSCRSVLSTAAAAPAGSRFAIGCAERFHVLLPCEQRGLPLARDCGR